MKILYYSRVEGYAELPCVKWLRLSEENDLCCEKYSPFITQFLFDFFFRICQCIIFSSNTWLNLPKTILGIPWLSEENLSKELFPDYSNGESAMDVLGCHFQRNIRDTCPLLADVPRSYDTASNHEHCCGGKNEGGQRLPLIFFNLRGTMFLRCPKLSIWCLRQFLGPSDRSSFLIRHYLLSSYYILFNCSSPTVSFFASLSFFVKQFIVTMCYLPQ